MRAMKRTVSIVLALMMVLGMATMGISVASAAETNTVTFTSNIGANGTIDYVPGTTEKVTVCYDLTSTYGIVNIQGKVNYDPTVLKIANTDVLPNLTNLSTSINTTLADHVSFNASGFNPVDFSTKATLVKVVFDVIGSGDTTVNLVVDYMTGNTGASSTTAATDVDLVVDGTADTTKMTTATAAEVYPEAAAFDATPFIKDIRLNLEGKIGVNIYFKNRPDGYTSAAAKNVYVAIDGPVAEQNISKTQMQSLKGVVYEGGATRFKDYFMPAYMITSPLTITFYDGDTELGKYTVTAADLAMDVIAANENSAPDSANMAKTLLNYATAVQTTFKANIDKKAGSDKFTKVLANSKMSAADQVVTQITADDIQAPADCNQAVSLTDIGISNSRMSLELLESVDIQYIAVVKAANESKFVGNENITVDGTQTITFNRLSEGSTNFVAVLKNVVSNKLQEVHTFTFADGKTFKTSAMSYLKGLVSNSAYTNLVSAMYAYNNAAVKLFG